MTTFKALATARRNLWYRIDRYLAELEKRASQPGRREGDHLLRALDHLEAGTYAEGERDMMWAEVATRQPDASELHPTASPQDLRKRFAAIAEAGRPPPPLAKQAAERARFVIIGFGPLKPNRVAIA